MIAGSSADSSCIQQIIDALKGSVGKGVPISITAVNDSGNWAVDVQNDEAVNSRAFRASRANGTVLIQADVNGVQVSSTGGAPATVVNISDAQTLTNKTLTSPVINGTLTGTAGFGAWSTFTPTVAQGVSVTGTVTHAEYSLIGKTVFVRGRIVLTSTGSSANTIEVSIPIAAGAKNYGATPYTAGTFCLYASTNATFYAGAASMLTSTSFRMVASGQTNTVGITPAIGLMNSDILSFDLTYEGT